MPVWKERMSKEDGEMPHRVRTRVDAEVGEIERALRGYGVLTRRRLAQECRARCWREPEFDAALAEAIERGSVVKLTDDLYESA